MTLHRATDVIKKILLILAIAIGCIVVVVMVFRGGVFLKNVISPPKATPPNQAFGKLPQIQFPQSVIENNFAYSLNTVTGTLPTNFPDRIHVYALAKPSPNLLGLEKAKAKAQALRFVDKQNKLLPEISLGDGKYQWAEQTGINRSIIFDIITFDFTFSSDYFTSLTVLGRQNLSDENNAIQTVRSFLNTIQLLPEDIDFSKIETPQNDVNYVMYPQLLNISNGSLVPSTSLSTAQVIRVDLYQKDLEYDLDTGKKDAAKAKMQLPIIYPNPPHSTMSFWIASGQSNAEVTSAEFFHREVEIPKDKPATYPIKTVKAAFEELQEGQGYIASYEGLGQEILISKVYLAYYLGGQNQEYLMPIIVFEGSDNFFGFVSALSDTSFN